MSLGYAEKLSFKADVGKLGLPEVFDSSKELQIKIEELAQLIQQSQHLVAFTGAGISTSCGIPDFRGPNGVWTLQHQGKPVPEADMPFHQARPGLTHMALVDLIRDDKLKFIISQNIDSLHLRSGVPRSKLSEIHGNSFMETCSSCGKEYLRDFEMETIGTKLTGRKCSYGKCAGKLRDTIVDWEGALPPAELRAAEKHCKMADLIICLGTSLQITPACNLPLRTVRAGGKAVIVNLQATPKDKKAALVIHGRVDEVIAGVMTILKRKIPPYIRMDRISIIWSFQWTRKETVKWVLRVESPHGQKAPLRSLKEVEVVFPNMLDVKGVRLETVPYILRRESADCMSEDILVKLHMVDCPVVEIFHSLNFEVVPEKRPKVRVDGEIDLLKLQREDVKCGRVIVIGAKDLASNHGIAVEYAIVTGVIHYALSSADENAEQITGTKRSMDNSSPSDDGDENEMKSSNKRVRQIDQYQNLKEECTANI